MVKKYKLTFQEEVLGTTPNTEEVFREYIGKNAPNAPSIEEEVEALGVDEVVDKGKTIFPKEGGKPFVWDYQIKGFFKDACGMLSRIPDTESSKLKAFKKVIDGIVFVKPRKIFFSACTIGNCERPLRVQGPKGERVALASSETVPEKTTIEFEVLIMNPGHEKLVKEWLNYGALRGIGQWRNSGKGRFTYEEIVAKA